MAKFVLLRDLGANFRRVGPPDMPPDPVLEQLDLEAPQIREAARDPAVIALARVMPTRLIEPEPLDDIRPDEAVLSWGIRAIGADICPFDGAGVRVAVLDTGVNADHAAFDGVKLTRHDFAGSGDDDANGHGTHCAGTIFGRDVDGARIGVARGVAEALTGKVLRDDGRGSTDMLFAGMLWASQARAQVIALSLSFDFPAFAAALVKDEDFPELLATSVALEGYCANLHLFETLVALFQLPNAPDGGAVVVAAGGNESRRTVSPNFEVGVSAPASAPGTLSVSALSQDDNGFDITPFSNTRPILAAPGGGILSAAMGGGLRALNGSSMAAGHVAGAAALWWQALRASSTPASASAVIGQLRETATARGFSPDTDPRDWGHGLVQAPPP